MEEMNHLDLLDKKEKKMQKLHNIQGQKARYLGEYRERIIAALNDDQILEDDLYPEIVEAMKDPRAKYMKMRRDLGLKFLKPYILEAEKLDFRYELIDGLSYTGKIGLVIVTDQSLDNEEEEVVIKDVDQDFLDVGLGYEFSKNQGKRICNNCYIKLEDKLPSYKEKFKKINFLDKLLGVKCPVCKGKQDPKSGI